MVTLSFPIPAAFQETSYFALFRFLLTLSFLLLHSSLYFSHHSNSRRTFSICPPLTRSLSSSTGSSLPLLSSLSACRDSHFALSRSTGTLLLITLLYSSPNLKVSFLSQVVVPWLRKNGGSVADASFNRRHRNHTDLQHLVSGYYAEEGIKVAILGKLSSSLALFVSQID